MVLVVDGLPVLVEQVESFVALQLEHIHEATPEQPDPGDREEHLERLVDPDDPAGRVDHDQAVGQ